MYYYNAVRQSQTVAWDFGLFHVARFNSLYQLVDPYQEQVPVPGTGTSIIVLPVMVGDMDSIPVFLL